MPARTTRSSTKRKFQRRVAQKLEGLVERGKREVARSARKVKIPRSRGQRDYAATRVAADRNSNSMGLR
jgi:hypothetical protein